MEKIEISPHIYMNPNTENGNRYLFARSPNDGQDHTTPGNTDLREDSLVVVDTNTLEQISVAALRRRPYLSQVYGKYSDSGWLFLSEDEVMTWAVNFLTGEKVAFFASGEIEENWGHLPQYFPVLDTELVARMDHDSTDDWTVSIGSLRDGSSRKIEHSFQEPIYDIAITPDRDWIAVHYRGTLEILKPDGSTLWRFDDLGAFNVKNLTFTACSGALASEHSTFVSPDGQYKVVTYIYATGGVPMPGQGGDRSGYARVFDANGNILCEIDVPLVNDVDEHSVRWRDGEVSIPGADGFESCLFP